MRGLPSRLAKADSLVPAGYNAYQREECSLMCMRADTTGAQTVLETESIRSRDWTRALLTVAICRTIEGTSSITPGRKRSTRLILPGDLLGSRLTIMSLYPP